MNLNSLVAHPFVAHAMSPSFLMDGNCAELWGGPPGLRGSPWTPRVANEFNSIPTKQADEGVGCRPGGLPHVRAPQAGGPLHMSAFANLLQDPPPTHAFELSEEGIAFAPVSQPALAEFSRFEPGVLLVSPLHDNIQQPQVLLDHIQSLAPGNGRKRRAAVILPDYCARVAVLDFDTFPTDPDQRQALVRFRLKKSVPFEVETAMVSYVEQPRANGSKIEVLAAVISSGIVGQYAGPFGAAR